MLVLRVALLAVRPGLQEQDCEALDWGLIILRNSGKAARHRAFLPWSFRLY